MITLSAELTAALQSQTIDPLLKLELSHGASSYTYDRERILDISIKNNGVMQSVELELQNADGALTALSLEGFEALVSIGAVTSVGDEYCDLPPMWVSAQRFDSAPGKLHCQLTLAGICNMMEEDKASESYLPDDEDTKTIKTLINQIAGATLACFSHCEAYDVIWDSEDDLIDSYQPKDDFRIYLGGNRLSAITRLLGDTKCVMRAENDGKLHVFVPTTTGTSYDYEYSLETGHPFFSKALRNRLVMPNHVTVQSHEDSDPFYSGTAQDTPSFDRLPKHEFHMRRLDSNAQAQKIAEAILSKAQMWSDAGAASVPLNPGAEVYDYVKVTDARQQDERVGNIGTVTHKYTANKNLWQTTFTFGNWQTVRKALANLGISSDDLEQYFSRLHAKHAYIENLLIDNIKAVWIDPDGNIDLSQIGDTLDNLPDGEVYARVKTMHLDAGQLKLDEHVLYKAGYDPSLKWEGSDLDDLPDGAIYQRVKSAALTADGLVFMDTIVVGEYGRVKTSSLSVDGLVLTDELMDGTYGKVVIGALTMGQIDLGKDGVINKTAANIEETITRKWAGETGADVTANKQSASTASISGHSLTALINRHLGNIADSAANDRYAATNNEKTGANRGFLFIDAGGVLVNSQYGISVFSQAANPRIEMTPTRICGRDSGGNIQFELRSTDGKAAAGGGNVILDSAGIKVYDEYLRFYTGTTYCGAIRGATGGKLRILSNYEIELESFGRDIVLTAAWGRGIDMSPTHYMDLPRRSTEPATAEGRLAMKSGTNFVKVYIAGAWRNIYFSGTGW